tara:strand:+ start:298 stop:969 length:672 start_codon:yes stop_codon:yes gene_type:complete
MPGLLKTIYSEADVDGYIYKNSAVDWASARDATSGTADDNDSSNTSAVAIVKTAGRGGGNTWLLRRSFFLFNTSDTQFCTSAKLYIYGVGATTADIIAVKSTIADSSEPSGLASGDFDAITGWSAGADNENNVRKYSDEISTWSSSAYNLITLNSNAIEDINANGFLAICILQFDGDLKNVEPGTPTFDLSTGMYYSDYSGTSRDPKIILTIEPQVAFFGTNF